MECDCSDCVFRGAIYCEHKKLMDEINRLRGTIKEAKDRIRYYFTAKPDGKFVDGQIQNVFDVLCRDDGRKKYYV